MPGWEGKPQEEPLWDSEDSTGLLVARLQLQRHRQSLVQPQGQRRQHAPHRELVPPEVQPTPLPRSATPEQTPRRSPMAPRPAPDRDRPIDSSSSAYRFDCRVVTRSTIATQTPPWSRAEHFATNARRCSGRSLFAGLTTLDGGDEPSAPAGVVDPDLVLGGLAEVGGQGQGRCGGAQTAVATPPPSSSRRPTVYSPPSSSSKSPRRLRIPGRGGPAARQCSHRASLPISRLTIIIGQPAMKSLPGSHVRQGRSEMVS